MTEMAVSRNAKAPDWEGLDFIFNDRISQSGAVQTQKFEAWLAGVQKDHAQVLKQQRLLREERATESKAAHKKGAQGAQEAS